MKAKHTKMMYEAPTTTAFRFPVQSPLGDVRTAWEMIAAQDNPAATTTRRRRRAYIVSDIVLKRRGDNLNMLRSKNDRPLIRYNLCSIAEF